MRLKIATAAAVVLTVFTSGTAQAGIGQLSGTGYYSCSPDRSSVTGYSRSAVGTLKRPPATDGQPPHLINSVGIEILGSDAGSCFRRTNSDSAVGIRVQTPTGERDFSFRLDPSEWVEVRPVPNAPTAYTLRFVGYSVDLNATIQGTITCEGIGGPIEDRWFTIKGSIYPS